MSTLQSDLLPAEPEGSMQSSPGSEVTACSGGEHVLPRDRARVIYLAVTATARVPD